MKTRTATTLGAVLALVLTLAAPAWAAQGDLLRTFQKPTPAANDYFGYSVAAVGSNVLVGVPGDSTGAVYAGAAYLFDGASGALLKTFLNPTPALIDMIGRSVASVGSDVLVGAPYLGNGYVYRFDGASGALLKTYPGTKPVSDKEFGYSVAAVGSRVLVGAPGEGTSGSAYIFGSNRKFPNPTPANDDKFGYSVAALGSNALVGAPCDNTGAIHAGAVYLIDGANGALLQTFQNPTPASNDWFGYSVAAVGSNVLVGAPYDSTGASHTGAAYLFNSASGALLRTFLNPTPDASDYFGASVAAVGNNVLVGAPNDNTGATDAGAAYLFDGATGALLQTFLNPTPAVEDCFSNSVAALGNNVLIAAFGEDTFATDAGAVYLFEGVPEPATLLLLGFGALGILSRRRAGRMDK